MSPEMPYSATATSELMRSQSVLDDLLKQDFTLFPPKSHQLKIAKTYHTLGKLQRELRHWEGSESSLISALTFYQNLGTSFVAEQAIISFDLALLKSERLHWTEAEDYFRFSQDIFLGLGGEDIASSFSDELADIWLHWGILKLNLKQWDIAKQLLNKAKGLYLKLGANHSFSPYADELAETWMNIAIVWHAQNETSKAKILLEQVEKLYLQLGASNCQSPHADELADTWFQIGIIFKNCRDYPYAKAKFQQAHDLFFSLHSNHNDYRFNDELAETQLQLTLLYSDENDKEAMLLTLQSVVHLYERMNYFSGDFIEELTKLNSLAGSSLVDSYLLFHQLSALLAKWQSVQIGDSVLFERTKGFWSFWVSFALTHNEYNLLVDIFCASHGQRLLEIVQSNHFVSDSSSEQKFLNVQQQLRKLELEILGMQQPIPSKTSYFLRDKKQHLKASYRIIRNEWLKLRQDLIGVEHNSLFLLSQLRVKNIQGYLARNEAVAISVSLESYGISGDPLFILVYSNRVDCIKMPMLSQAESAMNQLNMDFFNDSLVGSGGEDACLNDLYTAMQQYKNILQRKLNPDTASLHIISQEPFHDLPWQYFCPIASKFYPGIHAFLQRRQANLKAEAVFPNEKCPLSLLTYGEDETSLKRLYYLPAEIELITCIWGREVVETLGSLSLNDKKPRILFLLGHGSFDNGNAQFSLQKSKLNAHDIIAYPDPIYALGASSCLLAKHADIANEPLGLFSITACRSDIKFGLGAIIPVDDLWSTCLSLLFHHYWRKEKDPNAAMQSALISLESGDWPVDCKALFKQVFIIQLPIIFNKIQEDIIKAPVHQQDQLYLRCSNLIQPWTRHISYYIQQHRILIDKGNNYKTKQISAEILVDGFLENLAMNKATLRNFLPFWLWG